jgi:hypothetical protein
MAEKLKAKSKPKLKLTDKAQFERFVETARNLGVEEVGQPFEDAFMRIVPPVVKGSERKR